MTHDPLCPALEGEGLFVAYAGPVGGSDNIDCLTCAVIARVRDNESRARKDGFALTDIKSSGFRDGYAAALRDALHVAVAFAPHESDCHLRDEGGTCDCQCRNLLDAISNLGDPGLVEHAAELDFASLHEEGFA